MGFRAAVWMPFAKLPFRWQCNMYIRDSTLCTSFAEIRISFRINCQSIFVSCALCLSVDVFCVIRSFFSFCCFFFKSFSIAHCVFCVIEFWISQSLFVPFLLFNWMTMCSVLCCAMLCYAIATQIACDW